MWLVGNCCDGNELRMLHAIRCHGTLARTFFPDLKQTGSDGCFKASKMEIIIKEIVKEQVGGLPSFPIL